MCVCVCVCVSVCERVVFTLILKSKHFCVRVCMYVYVCACCRKRGFEK